MAQPLQTLLCLPDEMVLLAHDDGLNPPTSKLDAVAAFIFLLLPSSSNRLLLDTDDPEKIEEALINARFSSRFL